MSEENEQIIRDFIVESLEALDRLDQELVVLEQQPEDRQLLNGIFRIVHTIKGTCGFLGFKKLEAIAHVGENLLDSLRSGKLPPSQERITALLRLGDVIREIYGFIESSGTEGSGDYSSLESELVRLNNPNLPPQNEQKQALEQESKAEEIDLINHDLIAQIMSDPALQGAAPTREEQEPTVSKEGSPDTRLKEAKPEATVSASEVTPAKEEHKEPARERAAGQQEPDKRDGGAAQSSVVDSSLRVDVALLDQLMNLVGELVLARNQILQITKNDTNAALIGTSQRLNIITSELQASVMKTRMQPIANVWNKFPRVVRDVARLCGKEVGIEMEGKETDLDKTIIEAIKDPLTHIVRNAVDHGIETPDVRVAAGKCREGTLFLKAYHEGGCVIIEISDDGAGLDANRIKNKAIEKGLIRPDQLSKMTERDIYNLIFAPGFSTAEHVTNISGRGVGMDVVRSNMEKIGGIVDIDSIPGRGTTFRIKIPLTLAIVPALIVRSSGERFLVPQVSLLELVRVTEERRRVEIESVRGADFYRLRGQLLPLVYLTEELELSKMHQKGPVNIVVVKADRSQFGLVVDSVEDTEEIVVKPLGKQLKDIPVFAGAAIMGDGRVALVIDVAGLARKGRINAVTDELVEEVKIRGQVVEGEASEALIILNAQGHKVGMPLSLVNRLEQFEMSQIEHSHGRNVVQYRGTILPLVDLGECYGRSSYEDKERVEVVVYGHSSQMVGIVVDEIVDIVDVHLKLTHRSTNDVVMGSMVVNGKVTDILDVQQILIRAGYDVIGEGGAAAYGA